MSSERILTAQSVISPTWRSLHTTESTRTLERLFANADPPLMQSAGKATAQLAMALAPHADTFWIPCGPGNNGGDGLQAAAYLKRWGKNPVVSIAASATGSPAGARAALAAAQSAGVTFLETVPFQFDFCIDALFGIGTLRPFQDNHQHWIECMNNARAKVLAVDIPSGLNADTGTRQSLSVQADYTLSLLTLKPGLFTASGRDTCGEIWFNPLGCDAHDSADAQLIGEGPARPRPHDSHKGSYGDVAVIGGATGMTGAALLAASAALRGGAGRVYVNLVHAPDPGFHISPELMVRNFAQLSLQHLVVVAGCGAGNSITPQLPHILSHARELVIDADALNQIAVSPGLKVMLMQRLPGTTVLTPHPMEAARLLDTTVAQVQADRILAAQQLADRFQCAVVLKGSGTVICNMDAVARINPTGNARLACAGTGDVLAGLIGAHIATGQDVFSAATSAVYAHGRLAERWQGSTLTANALAQAI